LTDGDEMPEHLLAETAEELFEEAPCGYLILRPDGTILRANRTIGAWTRYDPGELEGRRFQALLSTGGRIYYETHVGPLLRMQGSVSEIALDVVRADGERLPVLVNAALKLDAADNPLLIRATIFSAADRRTYERELLRARREEQVAGRRAAFLAELGRAMVQPAGVDERVERLLDQLVPALADGAGVRLAEADRPTIERARGMELAAPAHEALVRVGEGGEAETEDGTFVLPLQSRNGRIGALAVRGAAPEVDGGFLAEIAERAALALINARLYEHERDVANALQRSLLAGEPPEDQRCRVATRYQAGVRGLAVGGDWHDAFLARDGVVGLVVGDVVGRGLQAATAMGQLRSATRALAGALDGPAAVLGQLDRFVDHESGALAATVFYAELDLASGRLRHACAGHLPPVLVPAGDGPELLWGGRSAPLGAHMSGRPRAEADTVMAPGDRIVAYTDGVIERPGEVLDAGLDRIVSVLRDHRDAPLDALPDAVFSSLLDGETLDDACLLCAEARPGT
jgi:PAS domain S-box-containing protein